MEFRLLGPVELLVAGRVVDAGGARQRSVVAALAVDAGRPVPVEALIDRVWGQAPPPRARHALQVYIARIRALLARDATGAPPVRVQHRSGGYALEVEPDRVDAHRFRRLVDRARDGGCPDRQRVRLLGQAFELWSDRPLADLPGEWAARVRQGWQQRHLDAVRVWAYACLRLDDPGAVLARLSDLTGEHPLVESLVAVFMRALYAAGRPADALAQYGRTRQLLVAELGAEPGPELRLLHRQILTADPVLTPAPAGRGPGPVPRQLPAPPHPFTGRAAELAQLARARDSAAMVVTAIVGMAGVGKTALALHAAHRLAPSFPDGQLFLDLHGFTDGVAPVDPGEALDRLLRGLGVAGELIPAGLEERAGLWRSRAAGRRLLLVLDNAATEGQVAPLLPGTPGCLVLVTSRRRLAGLDHTHAVSLDLLPCPDAVTLFTRMAGEQRLDHPPADLLAELVELCGRLPLALRIAAARLRCRPAWGVAELAERLRDHRHRLAELSAGPRSVTAALDLSYQHLDPAQRRGYRLLGLHPGPDIDPYAVAALLDTSAPAARRLLDQLHDAHLLQEPSPGRYAFHDLTRAHASQTTLAADPEPDRRAALTRLFDHYRHTAAVAMDIAHPYERGRRPPVPPARTPTPDLPDPVSAGDWLDAELSNLLAAGGQTAEHGLPEHTLHLSAILHRHLRTRGRYRDAGNLYQLALTTARTAGDLAGEVDARLGLGWVHLLQGSVGYQPADGEFGAALQAARRCRHRLGELDALTGLGRVHRLLGRHEQALGEFEQALRIARAVGSRLGELDALAGLATLHRQRRNFRSAGDSYRQLLDLARRVGSRNWQFEALHGVGRLHHATRHPELALACHRQAAELAADLGQPAGQARAHDGLAHAHSALHQPELAGRHWQLALEILTGLGTDHTDDEEVTVPAIRAHLTRLRRRPQPVAADGG